jgi:hypothetical protein
VYQAYVSSFTISDHIFIPGWKIIERNVVPGYKEALLDPADKKKMALNPKIIFSLDLERSGLQEVLVIFLPLFLMFFIGLFSFSFTSSEEQRMLFPLSLASISAMLSYRFVIQRLSPVAGYFMLSDYVFVILLSLAFGAFLINIALIQVKQSSDTLAVIRGSAVLLFHLVLITLWYYLIHFWVRV